MGQSVPIRDKGNEYQGTAAGLGGTFVANFPIPANQGARVRVYAFLSTAASGSMSHFAGLVAECIVAHLGPPTPSVTFPTALGLGQVNPNNSDSIDIGGSLMGDAGVQASDSIFGGFAGTAGPTLDLTTSGSNLVCTVTNNASAAVTANVTVIVDADFVGST